jgi:ATP-dependent Clp protease ATP-binding subunit ClpC
MNEWTGIAESYEELRARIEARKPRRQQISTSVDMPLSEELKRVLGYAAEEEERVGGGVGNEHLVLGLLREEGCFAAEVLREGGADLEDIRQRFRNKE